MHNKYRYIIKIINFNIFKKWLKILRLRSVTIY